jgi:hypothetical protein
VKLSQQMKVKLGEAGEHLVVSRLLARGLTAGQFPRGYKSDDILVEMGDDIVRFQVKTSQYKSWPIGTVLEHGRRFYAFVHFHALEAPDVDSPVVYVLPSATVKLVTDLHDDLWRIDHHSTQPGVPTLADPWRSKRIVEQGYPPGWLEQFREAWHLLLS